nr:ATPase F0F1 [Algoriphagus sp.]
MEQPEDPKKERKAWNDSNSFVKYIGLSFQLFGVIGAGTWFGWLLQQKSDM